MTTLKDRANEFLAILLTTLLLSQTSAAERPQRIVCAGGDLTEIIYALSAGDRIVAVDSTSVYPPEAREKSQIGYVRRISPEGVLSQKPDLVIGSHDMGPPHAVDQLRSAGINVALGPDGVTAESVPEKVRFVGQEIGLMAEADKLARQIEKRLRDVQETVAQNPSKKRVLFVLGLSDNGPLIAGAETAAESVIQLAGGLSVGQGFKGYKPMSREAILQANPDLILMMNGAARRAGGIDVILKRPEFSLTNAGKNKNVILMDGMLLLGFGPRTPEAIEQLFDHLSKS